MGPAKLSSQMSQTVNFAKACLREIQTPFAVDLLARVVSEQWVDVAKYPMPDPERYTDASVFAKDYLAWNLLRKADFLPTGVDTVARAIEAFVDSEERCAWINRHHGRDPRVVYAGPLVQSFEAAIWLAKEKIRTLLGKFSWDKASEHFGFSGGASTRLPRKSGHPFYKYQGKPDVTPAAAVAGVCALWVLPQWRELRPNDNPEDWVNQVGGSNAATVPKTAMTDRFICIEPDLNMYMQRGIGKLIRKALRTVGIDLDNQALNQMLALIGSRTGSLATIDLRAASDSVSLAIVEALVPRDWFEAMVMLRSPTTTLPSGEVVTLEKISSMGNGFTFELESLIFWALSAAILEIHNCEDRRLGVYGDDIVIHNSVAEPLCALLAYCGFETNKEKTFISGPFRESCGKHYFHGQDVSPFNIKEVVAGQNRSYWLLNSFNLWASRGHLSDRSACKLLDYIVKLFKVRVNHVPGNLSSESGVHVPSVDYASTFYSFRSHRYLYRCLNPVRRKHKPQGPYAVLTWLSQKGRQADPIMKVLLEKGEAVYRSFSRSTSAWADSPVRFVVAVGSKVYALPS